MTSEKPELDADIVALMVKTLRQLLPGQGYDPAQIHNKGEAMTTKQRKFPVGSPQHAAMEKAKGQRNWRLDEIQNQETNDLVRLMREREAELSRINNAYQNATVLVLGKSADARTRAHLDYENALGHLDESEQLALEEKP